jgi:hypothetical protein
MSTQALGGTLDAAEGMLLIGCGETRAASLVRLGLFYQTLTLALRESYDVRLSTV